MFDRNLPLWWSRSGAGRTTACAVMSSHRRELPPGAALAVLSGRWDEFEEEVLDSVVDVVANFADFVD
jgi:hypothetical protein